MLIYPKIKDYKNSDASLVVYFKDIEKGPLKERFLFGDVYTLFGFLEDLSCYGPKEFNYENFLKYYEAYMGSPIEIEEGKNED